MFGRNRQEHRDFALYTDEQVRRSLVASGIKIEGEVDTDFLIFCPYHSNFRTPAGEVAKESGHFFCFSCQASVSLAELISKVSGKSYFESLRLIKSKEEYVDSVELIDRIAQAEELFPPFDMDLINRLHADVDGARDYLHRRGITDESISKYLLGYSRKQDKLIIPIYSPDGVCVGFVARSIQGKDFKNSKDLPRKHTLFNIHRARFAKRAFVFESAIDAMLIEQAGGTAVATNGARISNSQIDLLKRNFRSIIVVRDNDEAGLRMEERLRKAYGSELLVASTSEGTKNVDDLTPEGREAFVKQFDNELEYILGMN